jgi:hypothetical protein
MAKKIYIAILLVIFGGIVLHAPISVGLGTIWPQFSLLIKSWKEILMLMAGLIALFLLYKNKQMKILREPIVIAIAAYATLHLALLFYMNQGLSASVAGLAIDLRYILYFSLVYIALRLYPEYRKLFVKVAIAGALVVIIFALLQILILPHDILKYIGYNVHTISPYLTVDQNQAFIRINSTLRGPNPLGAYAVIVLVLVTAAILKHKITKDRRTQIIVGILSAGGLAALWFSYSRSALIATVIALGIVLVITVRRKLSASMWITISIILFAMIGGLFMVRDNTFVSNVLLHENPTNIDNISSNEGHAKSLGDGVNQLIRQPLGAGIGSTGSASILSNKTEIIENQYLFTAHEVGWLGLALFMYIFVLIQSKLWRLRKDWFALGVFASGMGLAIIGLFLPVWVDDPTAIIWWGLAAIALFPDLKQKEVV